LNPTRIRAGKGPAIGPSKGGRPVHADRDVLIYGDMEPLHQDLWWSIT